MKKTAQESTLSFVAIHKNTQQHILVEAKSRHRPGVIAMPGAQRSEPDIKFMALINNAVAKDPKNPLVIFVDTNLPPARAELFYRPVSSDPLTPSKAMSSL